MKKESDKERFRVCWNVISACNSNCEYCHRFKVKEHSFKDDKKILIKMIKDGVTNLTWSGGEALLYPGIMKLMKIAKENGVKNKLITNGIILSQLDEKEKDKIFDKLDEIVLSIDSTNDETNKELGRGEKHYDDVRKILDYAKNKDVKVSINTVINSKNLDEIEELAHFLNNYKIYRWKFFKFMPFRGLAEENKKMFEVDESKVDEIYEKIQELKLENIENILYKTQEDIEEDIVLDPQANMYQTIENKNGEFEDRYRGNAMEENIVKLIKENRIKKEQGKFLEGLKVKPQKNNNNSQDSNNGTNNKEEQKENEDGEGIEVDE